jgi:hypothetical protein
MASIAKKNITAQTDEKNTTVILNLDRPREVRFGHKALKKLSVMTEMDMNNIDEANFSMEDLEKVMYCGMMQDAKEHGEDLQLSQMEDLLDKAEMHEILEAMQNALNKSFQKTMNQIKN